MGVVEYVRDCDEVVVDRPVRRRQEAPVLVIDSAPCPPPLPPSRPPVPTGPAGWGSEVVWLTLALLILWAAWEVSRWSGGSL